MSAASPCPVDIPDPLVCITGPVHPSSGDSPSPHKVVTWPYRPQRSGTWHRPGQSEPEWSSQIGVCGPDRAKENEVLGFSIEAGERRSPPARVSSAWGSLGACGSHPPPPGGSSPAVRELWAVSEMVDVGQQS